MDDCCGRVAHLRQWAIILAELPRVKADLAEREVDDEVGEALEFA